MNDKLTHIVKGLPYLTTSDLQILKDAINDLETGRREQRRKELWGNVVAAINKYQSEIGPINVITPCGGCDIIGLLDIGEIDVE